MDISKQIDQLSQHDKAKILGETAKISWNELERFYAQGRIILVSRKLDLIEVGYAVSLDDTTQVIEWMESGLISKNFNEQAKKLAKNNTEVWSVVIKPWVLIQTIE